ncbi:glycoside hydrolase family 3 protein [Paenibacillus sp. SC116]|uniref:glycoside hydrolase family 3 protein n=1 Tax=Paenibacillus sp. SC116 TaxID=2968986 RepID=UPI00215A1BE0|nr:glycoside hydrolase family 3 protein [Paenibacillus sp. SC116]MCR8843562.1 glycoside hydrolase family 3 protein [Paenibacillus sp. SC116]
MNKKVAIIFTCILVITTVVTYAWNASSASTRVSPISPAGEVSETEKRVTVEAIVGSNMPIEEKAKKIVTLMNDKEKIGQLVMYTPTHRADSFSERMIKEYNVGSALVTATMSNTVDTAQFTNQLQRLASETRLGIPLFISGDMEYGAAQRVPANATILPRQMAIGATRSIEYAEQAARITAKEAKVLGFQWSYSPVVDVNSNMENPIIGVRSFGEHTQMVSDMAVAQLKGYQSEGVLSSAKHFPGHGDTSFDTHSTLSKVSYSEDVLRQVHLPPFQAVIDQGIESIMTSHIIIEAIDPTLPATLSKKVLTGLLREDMGFKGIIITDAMVMEAISNNWGAGEAAVMAIHAGADIVMANGSAADQIETLDSLYHALQAGKIAKSRVDDAVARIITYKLKMKTFDNRYVDVDQAVKIVGNEDHWNRSYQMALDSVTLLKNDNVLPFDPQSNEKTLVVSMAYAERIAKMVRAVAKGEVFAYQAAPAAGEPLDATTDAIQGALAKAEQADRIIVFTQSEHKIPKGQIDLVNQLVATGKPVVAVALGNPSDIASYPDVKAYITAYAADTWYWMTPVPISWNATVEVIFGTNPKGKLPVTLSKEYPRDFGLSYR